jgi:SAM-dependent methyltransferase
MKTRELRPFTMKRLLRPVVHRAFSPRIFQFVRFRWWCLSTYLPRLVTSWFVKRKPTIHSFGAATTPADLAKRLQSVNVLSPTKLCRVMTKYGSDKGRVHNYTTVYSALFKGCYDQPLRILELGLGTNNPDLPSSMGPLGIPGASLRGWREIFPHALVYGADIDRGILFKEDRIKTFYCDQLDLSSIRELWSHPDLQAGVDVIIDDGLHTFEANVSFLEGSLDHLRPGGIYVCEDIMWDRVDEWCDRLETIYSKQYPTYEFVFAVLPDPGNRANNLLVVGRGQTGF